MRPITWEAVILRPATSCPTNIGLLMQHLAGNCACRIVAVNGNGPLSPLESGQASN